MRDHIIHESRKNTVAYGDPVFKESGDVGIQIWDYDARSYLGLIMTADDSRGYMIKRTIFIDKNMDMELLRVFTDSFRNSPDQTGIR